MAVWNYAQGRIPDLPEKLAADTEHFLTFVEDVAHEQLQNYRLGLGENPQRSEAKNRQPIVRLLANGYTCKDQCGWDHTSSATCAPTPTSACTR